MRGVMDYRAARPLDLSNGKKHASIGETIVIHDTMTAAVP